MINDEKRAQIIKSLAFGRSVEEISECCDYAPEEIQLILIESADEIDTEQRYQQQLEVEEQ